MLGSADVTAGQGGDEGGSVALTSLSLFLLKYHVFSSLLKVVRLLT